MLGLQSFPPDTYKRGFQSVFTTYILQRTEAGKDLLQGKLQAINWQLATRNYAPERFSIVAPRKIHRNLNYMFARLRAIPIFRLYCTVIEFFKSKERNSSGIDMRSGRKMIPRGKSRKMSAGRSQFYRQVTPIDV